MPLPSHKGNRGGATWIDGTRGSFTITEEVQLQVEENKVLVFQQLTGDDGHVFLRFGYYMLGFKPGRRGRWTWGESCPMFSVENLHTIVARAKEKGML
jgi:hypothetical protein